MSDDWEMKAPALRLAALIEAGADQELQPEILKLKPEIAALVVELDGVDYVLTLTRAPKPRPRALRN